MGAKAFVVYLVSSFSLAILFTLFTRSTMQKGPTESLSSINSTLNYVPNAYGGDHINGLSRSARVWPTLEFSWRSVLATVIGFFGSAFGTVGGVGGGGIFVPMLNLIVGFDTKSAAALSKCMIMGASASSVWYNLRVPHPTKEVPIIDYDLALLFQPMLMLGITIGVSLSVVFPFWLITILIIILFIGTSSRSFFKGIEMWKEETVVNKEVEKQQEALNKSLGEVCIDAEYQLLEPQEEKSGLNHTAVCGVWYWILNILQVPVSLLVFGYEAVKLCKENKKRRLNGNNESVCEAKIEWSPCYIIFCAFCGILGGTVGGLLGSGGGFILGPLLLELGVIPQVASATATFVMMFSSSLSVVEFYFLRRFPVPYALYLIAVSVIAGFWGQFFVRKLVTLFKRASIIVFILSAVIFASALTMGVVGVEKSIYMIHRDEYMGFLSFCQS
ncbi:hypothetical protein IFM89_012907 [Coptis chinensis]|uniref:Sulfite exporter TauE/SafE family protein n=1 Tax=Coptis chinensis TaxID=261450 RepID=A0A835LID1_9MAGN|nr:hypothetical protein IFM89_012907 [Coptis chinensis]